MLGNIIWSIIKELPFAVYRDKTSEENKNLSGRDYVTRKRKEAVSNWRDVNQWRQLITLAYWWSIVREVLRIFLAALAVGVIMVLGIVVFFNILPFFNQ